MIRSIVTKLQLYSILHLRTKEKPTKTLYIFEILQLLCKKIK